MYTFGIGFLAAQFVFALISIAFLVPLRDKLWVTDVSDSGRSTLSAGRDERGKSAILCVISATQIMLLIILAKNEVNGYIGIADGGLMYILSFVAALVVFITLGTVGVNSIFRPLEDKVGKWPSSVLLALIGAGLCLMLVSFLGLEGESPIGVALSLVILLASGAFHAFKKPTGWWLILLGVSFYVFMFALARFWTPADWPFLAGAIVLSTTFLATSYFTDLDFTKRMVRGTVEASRQLATAERQRAELEDARRLQLSMLPQEKPTTPQIEISWHMETATEVGGDYYDYKLDSDGNLTIVLGDATGHGMQAGTVVTASKSLFHSLANEPQIVETFSVMSRSLKSMNLPRLGMAMTMLKIHGNKLRLSSAGMPPMLLYRAETGSAEEVLIEGMPLGYSDRAEYEELEFELGEGDTVLLMSDGLPERMNVDDEWLDYPRVIETFESVGDRSPDEIIDHLVSVGEEWADGRGNDDDESFIVLKFTMKN